jgi:polyisoprenoid-binding protein YceI
VIQAASVDSGDAKRDEHLRSPDFFDVEQYPTITFRSTSAEQVGEDAYRLTGDLTIRDVTKPVTFDVEFLGNYDGFQGRRAGFHATTKLNREDFGLTWNVALESGGWLVGKEIKLEIDLAMDQVLPDATTADEAVAASA